MKTLKYIWRNIRRNPIRSLLTILSVGFSLALMTVLYGFLAAQETWKNGAAQANRSGHPIAPHSSDGRVLQARLSRVGPVLASAP